MTVDDLFMSTLIMWTGSTAVLIFYPGRNGLTGQNLFQRNFTGRVAFFYSDITDSVAVPPAPSQRLWTAGKGGRRRSDGVLQVLVFWGWASGAAQRCWIRFGSGKFFPAEQQQQQYRLRLSLFVMFWLTGELGTKRSTWASQWWRPYSGAVGFVLGKCNLMNIIIDASHFLTSGFLLVFLCFIGEPDNPCVEDEAVGNFCGSKILEVTLFLLHSLPTLRFSQNSFSY